MTLGSLSNSVDVHAETTCVVLLSAIDRNPMNNLPWIAKLARMEIGENDDFQEYENHMKLI